jgi:hypothetical protein
VVKLPSRANSNNISDFSRRYTDMYHTKIEKIRSKLKDIKIRENERYRSKLASLDFSVDQRNDDSLSEFNRSTKNPPIPRLNNRLSFNSQTFNSSFYKTFSTKNNQSPFKNAPNYRVTSAMSRGSLLSRSNSKKSEL